MRTVSTKYASEKQALEKKLEAVQAKCAKANNAARRAIAKSYGRNPGGLADPDKMGSDGDDRWDEADWELSSQQEENWLEEESETRKIRAEIAMIDLFAVGAIGPETKRLSETEVVRGLVKAGMSARDAIDYINEHSDNARHLRETLKQRGVEYFDSDSRNDLVRNINFIKSDIYDLEIQIAEAQRKIGKLTEKKIEFRKQLARYPDDSKLLGYIERRRQRLAQRIAVNELGEIPF
ncbi:MAG: hypothetical protein LBI17_03795 [Rickettsiales bacterium]|jgi:predicted acetyltransferase|nr:hypothetical protein [Rickettsiales bacterium]